MNQPNEKLLTPKDLAEMEKALERYISEKKKKKAELERFLKLLGAEIANHERSLMNLRQDIDSPDLWPKDVDSSESGEVTEVSDRSPHERTQLHPSTSKMV